MLKLQKYYAKILWQTFIRGSANKSVVYSKNTLYSLVHNLVMNTAFRIHEAWTCTVLVFNICFSEENTVCYSNTTIFSENKPIIALGIDSECFFDLLLTMLLCIRCYYIVVLLYIQYSEIKKRTINLLH